MDEKTIVELVGTTWFLKKLLGPTADYLGSELKTWTERRVNNVYRIFEIAFQKLSDQIDSDGTIPPRVLKVVLEEGSYTDDEFASEYFGGVMASSRTIVSRDDRGMTHAALVARLSTYQIRAHYLFYNIFKEIFNSNPSNLAQQRERQKLEIFIPFSTFVSAMDISKDENLDVLLPHIINGLIKENLIEPNFSYGAINVKGTTKSGLTIQPTSLGIELYLWAHGKGDVPIHKVLDPSLELICSVPIDIAKGAEPTKL